MSEGKLVFVNKHVTFDCIYYCINTILLKALIFFLINAQLYNINDFYKGLQNITILSTPLYPKYNPEWEQK